MWGWLTVIFLILKWITVAYTTTFTVATYVLLASLATQLGWYFVFVLLGSKCRKALQQELPFTKVLQTFWVGAVVCPVGVYSQGGGRVHDCFRAWFSNFSKATETDV